MPRSDTTRGGESTRACEEIEAEMWGVWSGDEELAFSEHSRSTLIERMIDKISVADKTGCWEWTAATAKKYGYIWDGDKLVRSHRLSLRLALDAGEFDENLNCNHRCDNPPCVNPSHLRQGTQRENILESRLTKLTEKDVREIKSRYRKNDVTMRELGEDFGVGQPAVSLIVNEKRWGHVSVKCE